MEDVKIYKTTGYAVVTPLNIVAVYKTTGYAVVTPLNIVAVYKTTGYAVVTPTSEVKEEPAQDVNSPIICFLGL